MKKCNSCNEEKTFDNFYLSKSTKDGYYRACKQCAREASKRSVKKNGRKPPKDPDFYKKYSIRQYGITEHEFKLLFDLQGGVCAICKQPPLENERLVVDHDHNCCPDIKTQKGCGQCVRGLLHKKCNTAIAFLEDDLELALNAVKYLFNDRSYLDFISYSLVQLERQNNGNPANLQSTFVPEK